MSKPITKVELTNFRGSTQSACLEFDPEKNFTILFGENGSGKSSILDAIDVVVNGGIGVLGEISIGHGPGKYLCTLGSSHSSLKATVHSKEESWHGIMEQNRIVTSEAPPKPVVKILRRNKILDLIIAQPKVRYEALKRFIDIGVVEESENSLKMSLDDVIDKIPRVLVKKSGQEHQLNRVWEAEHRPGPGQSAIEWAKHKVDTGIIELNAQHENSKKILNSVNLISDAKLNFITANSLVASTHEELLKIEQQIKFSPALKAANAIELIESLTKAKTFIEVEINLDKCPTCQRPIKRDELITIVDEQLTKLKDLKNLNDHRIDSKQRHLKQKASLSQAKSTLLRSMESLYRTIERNNFPEITELGIDWTNFNAEPVHCQALIEICERLESIKQALEKKTEGFQKDVNQFTSINEWYQGIKDADADLTDLNRIQNGLQKIFDIVHAERISFVQGVLDEIAGEANRLFQIIHPGEDISINQLKIYEERKGSVEQMGTFHGNAEIPPQAVFSESHLDTLGFCVCLALAKRENPGGTVLLIDDIFSSVDGPHLDRLMDLIFAESANFLQIIIATHYRLWWDRCQNAQGVQRIQLGVWSRVNGIYAQSMPHVAKQLHLIIENPILDRQAISSKAGILLEDLFDGLALLYSLPLPRNKRNEYTLKPLMDACKKLFSKHNLTVQRNMSWNLDGQPEDWQPINAKDAFDKVESFQFIRSWVGCHYNPIGADVPNDMVLKFGQATIELVEALTCPNCGYLATKQLSDGTALRCSCTKQAIRMTPVDFT